MNKRLFLLVAGVLLVILGISSIYALMNITECGILNESNTLYYLNTSIISSSTSPCINITSTNITFDCLGNTIEGDGNANYGILAERSSNGKANITIQNCTVTNWDVEGIFFDNATYNKFINLNVSNNLDNGIRICDSLNNIFRGITTDANGDYGIYIERGSHNFSIFNSSINFNSAGAMWIEYSDNGTITGNNITNHSYGITLRSLKGSLIYNNFFNNTDGGIIFSGSEDYNSYNITNITGTNVIGGSIISGNYWDNSTGGFSELCGDKNGDGICDEQYNISTSGLNIDFLPLTPEDNFAPVLNITAPENLSFDYALGGFSYTVYDRNLDSCWYSLDKGNTNTSLVCGNNVTGITSNIGTNTWILYANDTRGNNSSYTRVFEEFVQEVATSGGGSSYAVKKYWVKTYSYGKEFDKISPLVKALKKKHRIKLEINSGIHYLGIVNLTRTYAIINVSSSVSYQEEFNVGDEKRFDVNDDGFYDLLVKLNSIENDLAELTMFYLHERVEEVAEKGGEREPEIIVEEEVAPEADEKLKRALFFVRILSVALVLSALIIVVLYLCFKKLINCDWTKICRKIFR